MLISCCTVTQPGRLPLLQLCIGDFARQTHAERELVLVHDGDAAFEAQLRTLTQGLGALPVKLCAATPGQSLGALRNLAVAEARGELVCQWDDDDRYHPQRLELQLRALRDGGHDFCFLSDQLHWYAASGELSWDDWQVEPYPLNFIHGTLLGRRALMPRYPELRRGEDSVLSLEILRAGHSVARLRRAGWCYVYVFHGRNTFELSHHAAISRLKHLPHAQLLSREGELRARLAEYQPPLRPALLHAGDGLIDLATPAAGG